jgi:hypothetical protein
VSARDLPSSVAWSGSVDRRLGPQGLAAGYLLTVTATDVRRRKASASAQARPAPNVVQLNKSVRPRRARVLTDDD